MPLFVVETVGAPRSPEPIAAGSKVTASFVSSDGKTGFQVVEGPTAPTGAGPTWMAINLAPPAHADGGARFVVEERFDPPVDLSKAAPENPNLSPCLQGYEVNWFVSFIATDGSQCRCVYSAADADAVRSAYRSAGVPFVRVWPVRAP